ncbi:MAG TPA: hypothetical protein VFU86_10355 [Terriglobales bacterium]|nr:hypothetical protein [Terriglobales bacterium]
MQKKHFFIVAAVFLFAVASFAQECSIHTITGTYVFRGVGGSFVGGAPYPMDTVPDPYSGKLPLHSSGAFFTGSHVGMITVFPDSTATTLSWVAMGPYRTDPAGLVAPATVSSIGAETTADGLVLGCGGTIRYGVPGTPETVDKFITWDNGNEIRFIHTSTNTPATSIFVAKRVTRALDPAPRCGAQTMLGKYVATCSASVLYSVSQSFLTTAMMHLDITGGQINGNLFNRIEGQTNLIPVSGQITVNPDCSGNGDIKMPGLLPHPQAKMLFSVVTYDNGKGAFLMPLQLELPNGTRMDYFSPMSCQLERTN